MEKFVLSDLNGAENMTALLVLANIEAPLENMETIESFLGGTYKNGRMLIDQILHGGNTSERYIEFEFINGKIMHNSIRFVHIAKNSIIRKQSMNILCENNLIDCSILSSIQKRMLKKGIVI